MPSRYQSKLRTDVMRLFVGRPQEARKSRPAEPVLNVNMRGISDRAGGGTSSADGEGG
jgi:hypothetical protein